MKIIQRILSLFVLISLNNCANLASVTGQPVTGSQAGFITATGLLTLEKYKDWLGNNKSKFNEFINIQDAEICYFDKVRDPKGEYAFCTLVICIEEIECNRKILAQSIDRNKIVFMNENYWFDVITKLSVFCEKKPEQCRIQAQKYKDISILFLIPQTIKEE